jgi:hypothetical protein
MPPETEPSEIETEAPADAPTIRALLGQLADDTSAFARAEIDYLREEAGERVSYAVPALIMLGIAVALASGAIVAGLAGLVWWLGPMIGPGWAILAVVTASCAIAAMLFQLGSARLRRTVKPRSER